MSDDRFAALMAELHASHDRLVAGVEDLSADRLAGPSYHSWTIAEVLSHIGSSAEIFRMYVDAGSAGATPPTTEDFQPVWDAWNARSPVEQRDDFAGADQRLLAALDAVPDDERAAWRVDMFGGAKSLADVASMRLSEHAVHSWDALVALDPDRPVAAGSVPLVLDALGGVVGYTGRTEQSTRTRVETSDPHRRYLLETGPDGGSLIADGDVEATGTDDPVLRLPAEAFVRLVYGRLDPGHTPASVSADPGVLDRLRAAFPGF